jgi:probable F420-dependent oxidoreductase
VDLGIAMFVTDQSLHPGELGALAEQRGFDSLFVPEHTHIPLSRTTAHPRGELREYYKRTLDPFVALGAAAAATTRLLVGTGVCLVPQHDPIVLAKEIATLDLVSGGRFLFGVGAGWNVEEMANHGTDASKRFGLMRERVEAIKAIWTQDEAEYHGTRVDFDPIWSWPKPVQDPHPPVLVGGNGKTTPDRVLAFGDEWMPNRFGDDDKVRARIEKLIRRGREEAGREIGVTLSVAPTDPAEIERYAQSGVHRCVWYLPPRDLDAVKRALERYAAVVQAYSGG